MESSLNWGGQELRIVEQMQWLQAKGHATWLVARPGSAILAEAQKRGLPTFALAMRGSFHPVTLARLLGFLVENRVELLDTHNNRDAAYAMLVKWKVKVIRSRHVTCGPETKFSRRWIWKLGNHGVITTAAAISQQLAKEGLAQPERIYTARAGVDSGRYHAGIDSSGLKRELGIPAHHRVIANIGMIRKDKGQLYFLQACERIAAQVEDVSFVQIGEATADSAPYKEQVLALLESLSHKSRIQFLGYHGDIERYQAFCDVVMICSVATEAQTRLVSQAFFMGNNVIATTVGGLPEMIEHGRTGLLCEPSNPEALAAAALRLLGDPKLAGELRANAMAHAQREMTFERMMEGMLATYSKVLAGQ